MSMLAVVGTKEPLYKIELKNQSSEGIAHTYEFILHSALDVVDDMMWTTPTMYLKGVDTFQDQFVSAFVTAANTKFLLLHDTRQEENVKSFFNELHQLYMKLLMNPFYTFDTIIVSEVFDARVKTLARQYLH